MSRIRQGILSLVEICSRKNITDVVISPGSRSAPLTIAFARHPRIKSRVVVDERSAGFVALGMAQQTRRAAALVCTSGTAALNYAPAVAEAFYQKVPLLVLTADRPPEWLEQNDGQTILQRQLYRPHCNASFELPVDDGNPDSAWHTERVITDAIVATTWPAPGPVHINVPLREPLYPQQKPAYPKPVKSVELIEPKTRIGSESWHALLDVWNSSAKKLIVAGQHAMDDLLASALTRVCQRPDVVVLADVTSNCLQSSSGFLYDMILGAEKAALKNELAPGLLLTLGGPVVSKNLKRFLRACNIKHHWHVGFQTRWPDPFQTLQTLIPAEAATFLEELGQKAQGAAEYPNYSLCWEKPQRQARRLLNNILENPGYCELTVMHLVLQAIPEQSVLQLGNSTIVRLACLVAESHAKAVEIYANRGTSGIDGTVSTAVGAALASKRLTTLITGDLALFYDRNGLWQDDLPTNLKIIVFNNRGGGIFRILDGSRVQPELEDYFAVAHNMTAESVALGHGLDFRHCDSIAELTGGLKWLFKTSKTALLEVSFEAVANAERLIRFQEMLKEIK